jgi:hypothetical protein
MADFTRQYHYYYALTGDYENARISASTIRRR